MSDSKQSTAALASKALDRIEGGLKVLAEVRAARAEGKTHAADNPETVRQHRADARVLFQGREKLELELPIEVKAVADALMARDLVPGPEAFFERCLAAYLAERGDHGIDKQWATTVERARAEVAGRGDGGFDAEFTERLAEGEVKAEVRDAAAAVKDRGAER
jgi:hypothetical protein